MSPKPSKRSLKKVTSSDGNKTELIQLIRNVNRQSIRDHIHLHMAEQSICSEWLQIKQFSKDVENEIFRGSGRTLDASYYSKLNTVLMNLRRLDILNNIARKAINAKNLVSMSVLFSCLKCGKKAKMFSLFCSGDCNRRYGKTSAHDGKERNERIRRGNVSKPKPQIPASFNPVVNLNRLSERTIAGLSSNRCEPTEKLNLKLEDSSEQSISATNGSEPSEKPLIKEKLPSIQLIKPCNVTLTLLEVIDVEDDEMNSIPADDSKSRSNQQRHNNVENKKSKAFPSEIPVQDELNLIRKVNESTVQEAPKPILKRRRTTFFGDTSLIKICRKSTIDEPKPRKIENRIVQGKPKPFPSEIMALDESKYIQKGNETTLNYKPKLITQRRQTIISDASLIKNHRKSTIGESKQIKIENRILQANPEHFPREITLRNQRKPIQQRRQTTIISHASKIKIRRKSISDEPKSSKIEKRRKSLVDSMKAVKSNKAPRPKVSEPPIKTHSEIDEARAKMRQLFQQHLEQLTLEQLELTPYINMLTNHETVVFARDLEQEMFDSFGYGSKYLKKHRELVLSLRNRNNNLIVDIIRKVITPQRLVHMTRIELAGPDNIEERENIERRNMELLAQSVVDELAHPPVLFRMSEEEVIHTSKPINVDRNTSARDLLTAYNDLTGANLGDSSSDKPASITKRRISFKGIVTKKD